MWCSTFTRFFFMICLWFKIIWCKSFETKLFTDENANNLKLMFILFIVFRFLRIFHRWNSIEVKDAKKESEVISNGMYIIFFIIDEQAIIIYFFFFLETNILKNTYLSRYLFIFITICTLFLIIILALFIYYMIHYHQFKHNSTSKRIDFLSHTFL